MVLDGDRWSLLHVLDCLYPRCSSPYVAWMGFARRAIGKGDRLADAVADWQLFRIAQVTSRMEWHKPERSGAGAVDCGGVRESPSIAALVRATSVGVRHLGAGGIGIDCENICKWGSISILAAAVAVAVDFGCRGDAVAAREFDCISGVRSAGGFCGMRYFG